MTRLSCHATRRRLAALVAIPAALALLAQPLPAPISTTAVALAADGDARLTLVPDGSEARYRAQELLFGQPAPSEAVGRTRAVSGELVLLTDGTFAPESRIVIDLRTLQSDESRRDNYIQFNTLQTSQFPTADLAPLYTAGLPMPLGTGQFTFQLVGNLTVHGVTQQTVWDVAADVAETEVAGAAATRVRMTDFGMTPPQAGPVLSIEDDLTLEIELVAARSPVALTR